MMSKIVALIVKYSAVDNLSLPLVDHIRLLIDSLSTQKTKRLLHIADASLAKAWRYLAEGSEAKVVYIFFSPPFPFFIPSIF